MVARVRRWESHRVEIMLVQCDRCGREAPSYEAVSYGSMDDGYEQLCGRCFNAEIATVAGLDDFEHVEFKPVRLTDSEGKPHEFHLRTHLFGTGVALDAFEVREDGPAGYQFQIIGEPEEDLLALLGRLIEKIRRALAMKHLVKTEHGLQIGDAGIIRGLIESDVTQDLRTPLLVIDGREISWEKFGQMLMTFEGFQFKMEIRDRSEEC